MMRKEIILDKKGIPLKPGYFFGDGPFDIGDGLLLKFEEASLTNLNIVIPNNISSQSASDQQNTDR